MIIDIVKVFVPATLAFIVGIILTPLLTRYLYVNQLWKKKAGKVALGGGETPIFNQLHKEREVGTPKMGGVIIWVSSILVIVGLLFLSKLVSIARPLKLVFFILT